VAISRTAARICSSIDGSACSRHDSAGKFNTSAAANADGHRISGTRQVGAGHSSAVSRPEGKHRRLYDEKLVQNIMLATAYYVKDLLDENPKLNDDDILRQFVIMELMSNFALDIKRVEKKFNISFNKYFKDAIDMLQEFKNAELITIDENFIKANSTGAMLIRNIAMPFDAYLNKIPEDKRRFSKTI
jgi:coproporphyrinogen III oxidase-like Fe-S oxidoreductase